MDSGGGGERTRKMKRKKWKEGANTWRKKWRKECSLTLFHMMLVFFEADPEGYCRETKSIRKQCDPTW